METSPANLPPSAVGLGEGSRRIIENNCGRIVRPTEKASVATITDALLRGRSAVFIPGFGDVKIAGGVWKGKPFSHHAGRGSRAALSTIDFFRRLATHHGHWGGQHLAARSGE
ncbi:rab1 small GTP-binding protein [Trypanosoma cruzi]|nr:rab1 small GTP-binding protein [Trypanosoma cruzi]